MVDYGMHALASGGPERSIGDCVWAGAKKWIDWNSDFRSLGAAHDQEIGFLEATEVGEEEVLAIRESLVAEIIELRAHGAIAISLQIDPAVSSIVEQGAPLFIRRVAGTVELGDAPECLPIPLPSYICLEELTCLLQRGEASDTRLILRCTIACDESIQ
ncbi:hypothetical protein FIBSPDRAFT_864218 [Athelia psychrophila]|uniref:Uncharacterized protein n=1 Tax=Athelia psychrophila TaxID=1759441 RepID=A0A166GR58_9AGAM|nr:hypothetical protein FIBSPDRAFT_864218 [Fibularhizoctonia sp. CBS 109695]